MFHMPALIFLFGYNVKYSPKKIVYHWCIPYAIFQSMYILFSKGILNANVNLQFTTPYWLLWYMLACICYQLLLPLFDTDNKSKQLITLVCAFVISILVGYENSIGYYMSLSRFFVFQPWFLLGYYSKKNHLPERLSLRSERRFPILFASALTIAILFFFADALRVSSTSYNAFLPGRSYNTMQAS